MSNTTDLAALARIAADTASRAAIDYLFPFHGKEVLEMNLDVLQAALRSEVKAALGPALDAAKADDALGAGAEATFVASMQLAGIRAAKTFQRADLLTSFEDEGRDENGMTEEDYRAEHLAEVYAEAGSGARSLGFDTDSCYQAANEAVSEARSRRADR